MQLVEGKTATEAWNMPPSEAARFVARFGGKGWQPRSLPANFWWKSIWGHLGLQHD